MIKHSHRCNWNVGMSSKKKSVFFEKVKYQIVLEFSFLPQTDHLFIQLSVFTCLVPDNSHMDLIVREDPFNPHATFERWV